MLLSPRWTRVDFSFFPQATASPIIYFEDPELPRSQVVKMGLEGLAQVIS